MSSSGTERFNKDGVQSTMNTIGTIFQEISDTYAEADKQMVSMLTTPDGAIYGEGATKVLSAWDENSGTLEDFMNTFDNWAALVSGMANEFTNLEEGTYKVKDSSPYTEDDIANRARDFHTTALKTEAGITAFNTAQSDYYNNNKDKDYFQSYDNNGIAYTSVRRLENGKIVETKVYKDEQGNLIAEEEHWAWNDKDKKFEATTKYYSGGELKDNQYDNTNAKSITKDEFDKKYYTDANTETIVDNYCNKYFTDYYGSGELSDEAKEELAKLPKDIQEKVVKELESRKNTIDSNAINREYNKDGKIEKITYKEGDETREIIYDYDEEGNISSVKYKINDKGVTAQEFYEPSPNAEREAQTGSGNTGSEPANNQEGTPSSNTESESQAAQASVTVDTENRTAAYDGYTLSQGDGKTYITDANGNKYEVRYDPNTRTYEYYNGDKKVSEDVAGSLNEAMEKITEDDYAKGVVEATEGNTKYSIDNDGNLVVENPFGIDDTNNITMTVEYDKDSNQPTEYTLKTKSGATITTLTPDEYDAIMNNNGTATVTENGKTVTFEVDTENKKIIKTTSDADGNKSRETASIDENGVVTVEYENNGKRTKIYQEYKDHSSEEVFTDDGSTVTEYWNTEDGAKDYNYNTTDTFEMTKNNKGEVTKYSYNGHEVSEDQYDKLKQPIVDNGDETTTERKVQNNGRYIETTYDNREKVLEVKYQDTNGEETSKETYTYKQNGDLDTETITGKNIESKYGPHKKSGLDGATQTITYNDDGTITETITTIDGETYESKVDKDYQPIEYTSKTAANNTHEEYVDGNIKTKTVDSKTEQNVYEYGDEAQLTKRTVRYKGENEDVYNDNIKEVYEYTNGKDSKLVERSTMVGGERYYYNEKGTGTSNEKFTGYTFSKETIDLIAENQKAPEFIAECNKGTKNNYKEFLDKCENGDIITFGEGQYLQYDTSAGFMGSTEVVVTTDKSAAYVVKTTKAGNKILVNVNDETEYYYIETLSSDASLKEYGSPIGSISYDQLKIMRKNYNGEGKPGYNENDIRSWTVADAIKNNSKPYTGINGQEIAQTTNATITIDGHSPNNSNLKNEGYIDDIMKDPGRVKYQVIWPGTNGNHNFVYNYDTKQYTYEDKHNGCTYIYDPVTGKVYKLN